MAKAAEWFEAQRREHLAVVVVYQPTGSFLPRECRATVVTGRWESVDASGQIVRTQTRDFFIHKDELPQDPRRGDRIVWTENGAERTFEVAIPGGAQHPWQWADRTQTLRRIHTQAVQGSAAVLDSTLLVRAIGVSTAAAITDQQIAAQLTLDLGQNRTLAGTFAASAAYVYVVLPNSFGDPSISIGGFRSTAFELTTRAVTFSGQAARTYRVYRSTYPITGNVLVEVA